MPVSLPSEVLHIEQDETAVEAMPVSAAANPVAVKALCLVQ